MKKFVKGVLFFSLPVLLFLTGLEVLLRQIPNDLSYKRKYLDRHSREVETLFVGSSHAYFNINPYYIKSNSFNAAYLVQTLDLDWAIIRRYDGRWDHLKNLVIPVDYLTLFMRLTDKDPRWRIKEYQVYWGFNTGRQPADYFELANGKFAENLERARRYLTGPDLDDMTCTDLGYGAFFSWCRPSLEESAKISIGWQTASSDKYFAEMVSILGKIIAFADARHIRVILFTAPGHRSYVSRMDPRQLKMTFAVADSLVRSDPNVRYFNFLTDPSYTDEDFYDADHLTPYGAQKFSLKLDSLLMQH